MDIEKQDIINKAINILNTSIRIFLASNGYWLNSKIKTKRILNYFKLNFNSF